MCSLFGVIDYNHSLSGRQLDRAVNILAQVCEVRGSDATGIAYNYRGGLKIFKRPKPAHKLNFRLPSGTSVVMGHTRMATQGDQRLNRNNHTFRGRIGKQDFALAHNGMIWNDAELRHDFQLPKTDIETDSYVAVQLIEKSGSLELVSLGEMAEKLEGSFTFTLLDSSDAIYFIKGNNPLCIYHWDKTGLYMYASTEELLQTAVKRLDFIAKHGEPDRLSLDTCEILKLGRNSISRGSFNIDRIMMRGLEFPHFGIPYESPSYGNSEYLHDLKTVSNVFGFTPADVDLMVGEGMTPEEIEDLFYDSWL